MTDMIKPSYAEMMATAEAEVEALPTKMRSCVGHSKLPVWIQEGTGLEHLQDRETHMRMQPGLLLSNCKERMEESMKESTAGDMKRTSRTRMND
jgi:hypothetical protein